MYLMNSCSLSRGIIIQSNTTQYNIRLLYMVLALSLSQKTQTDSLVHELPDFYNFILTVRCVWFVRCGVCELRYHS